MRFFKLKRSLVFLFIISLFVATILTACGNDDIPTEGSNKEEQRQDDNSVGGLEDDDSTQGLTDEEEVDKMEYEWPEDFSLFEAYEDDFLIGTIYTDAARSSDKDLILKHFNVITPENLMKPQYMQPKEGEFNYKESDQMIGFAEENETPVIGHTLAWHQQSARWMGANVGRDEAIGQLKSHIMNVAGNYKGKILAWDVVNEAINDGVSLPDDGDWTKCLRQTQWYNSIGPDYLAMAFTFAREADPDAKLYYNDYNLNNKSKADIVYAMVKDFQEQGIPIDGIGMQGHYNVDTSVGTVEYSLNRFSELGVEVSITELDIGVNGAAPTGLTKEQEIAQANKYAELFILLKDYSDIIERVTFWGYTDHKSWRSDSFPCLFNKDNSPKEAAYAVLEPEIYLFLNKTDTVIEPGLAKAKYGTPTIDAEIDDIWNSAEAVNVDKAITAWEGAEGTVKLLWDEKYVYALFEVTDSLLNKNSPNAYEQDSVEIFLDQYNDKTAYYDIDDGQYRVNYEGISSFGDKPDTPGFTAKAKKTGDGYIVEMAIPLLEEPKEGVVMGFDAQVNDSNEFGMRQSIAKFNDPTDNSWQSTELWGELLLEK